MRAAVASQREQYQDGSAGLNHAPACGSRQPRQQRQDHARDVLAQGGSEDMAGAVAHAERASSGAKPSNGSVHGQRGLCSK